MLICDGFGTHETLEILEFCFESNIILCRIPSHTSHKLQPCNIAVFGPLKTAYRGQVERLERGNINTIGKKHFTSLYSPEGKGRSPRRTFEQDGQKMVCFRSTQTEYSEIYRNQSPH
jgi:hypothetical protein